MLLQTPVHTPELHSVQCTHGGCTVLHGVPPGAPSAAHPRVETKVGRAANPCTTTHSLSPVRRCCCKVLECAAAAIKIPSRFNLRGSAKVAQAANLC